MTELPAARTHPIRPEESYPKLISLAVHEFRTPASVVGGYLRMLQRDADPPMSERQRKMIDEAAKSCARLVELVAELSEVGKLDTGTTTLASEPIDLFALVDEVAKGVHEAEDREVRVDVRGPTTGAMMTGDATRLRGAIQAILRAILREQPKACTVVAERRMADPGGSRSATVVFAREDSVQAAYDADPAVFDEKRGGLGLALPIARRIIEAHGGRIWSPAAPGRDDASREAAARSAVLIFLPLETNR